MGVVRQEPVERINSIYLHREIFGGVGVWGFPHSRLRESYESYVMAEEGNPELFRISIITRMISRTQHGMTPRKKLKEDF